MSTISELIPPANDHRSGDHWPLEKPARVRYPSDLNDRQWACVSPLVATETRVGRPRSHSFRDIVDAINYRWQTGCVWRMLPHDFPPWATVYCYFRRWQRRGLLRQIREVVLKPPRVTDGAPPPEPLPVAETR